VKTIAWDVDDVLNDLMLTWFKEKWQPDHPACKINYENISENPPNRLLNTDIEEYSRSLDEFRLSGKYEQMAPIKEVLGWFRENGNNFRHIALTAVPLSAAHLSAQWVIRNFGPWIRTFHFVPSKRAGEQIPQYDNDKGDYLKWIQKVDLLVEDNSDNVSLAKNAGVKGIVIPRPWNKNKMTLKEALAGIS